MQANLKKRISTLATLSAVLAFASLSVPQQAFAATPKPVLVQDVDQPARQAFQTSVAISAVSSGTGVPLPAGKRLVVEYVSIAGDTNAAGVQPYINLYAGLTGGNPVAYTFTPIQSALAVQQFGVSQQTKIYADTLYVSFAFAGSTPLFYNFDVSISGYLVNVP